MKSAVHARIREILFSVWDPIGVRNIAPPDEYDTYVVTVHGLLKSEKAAIDLADYLTRVEAEQMGLENVADRARQRKTAIDALMALRREIIARG